MGQVGLAFCLTAPDAETCLVLVEAVNEESVANLEILQAERALFTFHRQSDGTWALVHRLYCLTEPPAGTANGNGRQP